MKRNFRFLALTAVLTVGGLYGQDGPPPGPPPGGMGPGGGGFGRMGPGMGGPMHKVVTGAPYSADVSNQVVETLSDGNTIQRTTTGHVARDPQGRTYSQETINGGPLAQNGPVTITFINDPVGGYAYVLNASTKTATRRAIKARPAGEPPAGASFGRGPGRGRGDSANVVSNDLGTQNVGGVSAQGKSVTRTIPAQAMGNAQPIVSTNETWYSPDLQILVLAKRYDPRVGQSTYSLTNIQRTEPAATLFQVPSDYTVKDAANGPGQRFNRQPQGPQF
jgi:hypothetical protein